MNQEENKNIVTTSTGENGQTIYTTSAPSAIPVDTLGQNTPMMTVPKPPQDTTNYSGIISGAQATADTIAQQQKDTEIKRQADLKLASETTADNTAPSWFSKIFSDTPAPSSLTDQYNTAYNNAGIGEKSQAVVDAETKLNSINAEIAGITAEAKANQLKISEQPIVGGIVGGQQARLEREAAIRALPLQAQALAQQAILTGAQGNLQLAQDKLNTVFKLQTEDADRQYNYKKELRDKAFEIANDEQKAKLTAKQKKDDQEFTLTTDFINNAQTLSTKAMENGQSDIAAQITQISPSDPKRVEKLAALQAKVVDKNATLDTQIKKAQLEKLQQEIDAGNPIVPNNIMDPSTSSEVKNSTILTALLKSSKVGQTTKTQIANSLGVINAIQDLATTRQTSGFTGISPFNAVLDAKARIPFTNVEVGIPFRNTFRQKEGIENNQYLEAINLKVQIWASGASLTKTQTDQVERLTPRPSDTDNNLRTKMNGLVNFMLTQSKSQLQSEGIDFQPEKVNLFETYDLLKKASPEQKAALKAQGLIN